MKGVVKQFYPIFGFIEVGSFVIPAYRIEAYESTALFLKAPQSWPFSHGEKGTTWIKMLPVKSTLVPFSHWEMG